MANCGCTEFTPKLPEESRPCPPDPCAPVVPVPVATCEELCDSPPVETVEFKPQNECDTCMPAPVPPAPAPAPAISDCVLQVKAVLVEQNGNTVTIHLSASGNAGSVEYSTDRQSWQDSNVFTIPAPAGPVVFYAREKARTWCEAATRVTLCLLKFSLLDAYCVTPAPAPVPVSPVPVSPTPAAPTPAPVAPAPVVPVPICTSAVLGVRCHLVEVPTPAVPVAPVAPTPAGPTPAPVAPVAPAPVIPAPAPPCGGTFSGSQAITQYYMYPEQLIYVQGDTVSLSYVVYDNPNRFNIRTADGILIWTSGWLGTATGPGPWGATLSTQNTGTVSLNVSGQSLLKLTVETSPGGQGLTDTWDFTVGCQPVTPTPACAALVIDTLFANDKTVTIGLSGYNSGCTAINIEYSQDPNFSSVSTSTAACSATRAITVPGYGMWYFRAKKYCSGSISSAYSNVITRNVVQPAITNLAVSQNGNQLSVTYGALPGVGQLTYELKNEAGQIVLTDLLPQNS